ncbi:unnamed protein product [Trichogramma brassicae]|uniref:Uncharacterized protein n=1 Tax=Trichogramma brassicae TaxID=86971 RepID=A0A6H5IPN6_9HYME|nr:unnamed protein product [Trichogramma brassicae]
MKQTIVCCILPCSVVIYRLHTRNVLVRMMASSKSLIDGSLTNETIRSDGPRLIKGISLFRDTNLYRRTPTLLCWTRRTRARKYADSKVDKTSLEDEELSEISPAAAATHACVALYSSYIQILLSIEVRQSARASPRANQSSCLGPAPSDTERPHRKANLFAFERSTTNKQRV